MDLHGPQVEEPELRSFATGLAQGANNFLGFAMGRWEAKRWGTAGNGNGSGMVGPSDMWWMNANDGET